MTYICKAAIICNKCGARRDTTSLGYDPLSPAGNDGAPKSEGWVSPKRDIHLCPDCAKAYLLRKAEVERELNELAGIETIEFEL